MERCKNCNAPILWAETYKGRRIPVDPSPDPEGELKLIDQGKWHLPLAEHHAIRARGIDYYTCHFETCRGKPK